MPSFHSALSPVVPMSHSADAAGQHRAGDVRAHERVHAGGQVGLDAKERDRRAEQRVRLKGSAGEAVGAAAGEQVEHGGVACDDERVGGGRAGGGEQLLHGVRDLPAQQGKPAVQRGVDAAHHVGGDAGLGVERGGGAGAGAGGKVVLAQRDGGGADVHGGAGGAGQGAQGGGEVGCGGLDAGVPMGFRQRDVGVAQQHGLAAQTRTGAPFRLIGRRDVSGQPHGALAACAAPAAGVGQRKARGLQRLVQHGRDGKGDSRGDAAAMDGQFRHGFPPKKVVWLKRVELADYSSEKSTMPK